MAADRILSSQPWSSRSASTSWPAPRHPSKAWPPRPLLAARPVVSCSSTRPAQTLICCSSRSPLWFRRGSQLSSRKGPGVPRRSCLAARGSDLILGGLSRLAGGYAESQDRTSSAVLYSPVQSCSVMAAAGAGRGEQPGRQKERQLLRLRPCHWQIGRPCLNLPTAPATAADLTEHQISLIPTLLAPMRAGQAEELRPNRARVSTTSTPSLLFLPLSLPSRPHPVPVAGFHSRTCDHLSSLLFSLSCPGTLPLSNLPVAYKEVPSCWCAVEDISQPIYTDSHLALAAALGLGDVGRQRLRSTVADDYFRFYSRAS